MAAPLLLPTLPFHQWPVRTDHRKVAADKRSSITSNLRVGSSRSQASLCSKRPVIAPRLLWDVPDAIWRDLDAVSQQQRH
jgi:hypothetical protein